MKSRLPLCVVLLSLLAGSVQSQAAAPIAVTVGTSDVSSNAATLHGMVTPRAANSRAYFQWGLTTNYGNLTATQILSGSVAVPVQQSIAGLTPLTTYHFRTVARNAYGVRYGTNFPFTTAGFPPAVTTENATGVTTDSATLNATVNPNGVPAFAFFEWGLTTNYGNTTTGVPLAGGTSAAAVQGALSNLTVGTTYHFRVVATNSSGLSFGADNTLTLLSPPSVATATPTDITTNSATLRGTVNPKGLATAAYFEWGLTTNYGMTTASQALGAGSADVSVQANLSGLATDTPYHYRMVASNALGITHGNDVLVTPTVLLYLYAGESWTYEFHDLPYTHTFPQPGPGGHTVYSTFFLLPNSYTPDASVRYELFENSTNEPAIATTVLNSPANQGIAIGGFYWSDGQGTVRLTMLAGAAVVSQIYVQRNEKVLNSVNNYANTFIPTKLPQPAEIRTQFVSSVSFESGVIAADINAKNLSTAVFVEWGTATNYGSVTGVLPLNFDYFVRREIAVSNLASATLYHLRVVATNNAGITYGHDLTFTTPFPATVVTLPANERQATAVKLNAAATINGFATSGYFEWGLTTNYGQVTPVQDLGSGTAVTNIFAQLIGLAPQSMYHCRAVVYTAGITNHGGDVVFSTTPVPTNLVVTNLATDDVRGAIERGGTVLFNCDGVVVLSNHIEVVNDVIFDASGHSITFSGSNATRIFKVLPGTALTLTNITLVNGRSTNGGAIYNEGTVVAHDCRFYSNVASGAAGANGTNGFSGASSASYNPSAVTDGQPGQTGAAGGAAFGGAILNYGRAELLRCALSGNSALAGSGGNGGRGGNGGSTPLPFPSYGGGGGNGDTGVLVEPRKEVPSRVSAL
jgi:hypothetical protein